MGWARKAGITSQLALARRIECTEGAVRAAFRRGHCSRRMARDLERLSDGKLKAAKLMIGLPAQDAA